MVTESELLKLISHDQLTALQRYYHPRGRKMYIPATLLPRHPLVDLLGPATAKTVIAAHGGDRFTVSRSQLLRRRNAGIIADRRQGHPAWQVAKRYGLAERTIRHICSGELATDDRPLPGPAHHHG